MKVADTGNRETSSAFVLATPCHRPRSLPDLPIDVVFQICRHLDGTTLARASSVCRAWWQITRDDQLWRDACYDERRTWVGAAPRKSAPPAWAIERAKRPDELVPPRSWHQAYRLLAMLEHGHPYGSMSPPEIVVDRQMGPPPHYDAVPSSHWLSSEEARAALTVQLGSWPALEQELLFGMRTLRRQITQYAATAAIRDARGHVLMAWREQSRDHLWQLPLRQAGILAGEVRLIPREPGDEPGIGDVHVLTRNGHRWRRWQWGHPAPVAEYAGRAGQMVRVQERRFWLAADEPDKTYSKVSVSDFSTGACLQYYSDNHRQISLTIFTELGPTVGWVVGGWQGRIVWSTKPELIGPDLCSNNYRRAARFGDRPQRLKSSALPREAQVIDTSLSEEVPGRVLLWWKSAFRLDSPFAIGGGYVDGWGNGVSNLGLAT